VQSTDLNDAQIEIMHEFYSQPLTTVTFLKKQRRKIEQSFKKARTIEKSLELDAKCPAFRAELDKVLSSGKNIQGAVFSECVYAHALAQKFGLDLFVNPLEKPFEIDDYLAEVIDLNGLSVRYIYTNFARTMVLIQAGGNNGVDCALVDLVKHRYFTIELKEPYAKTPEPDLPKYSENGDLIVTQEFLDQYPQFESMLDDTFAKELNFFLHAGKNFNKFTEVCVENAANESYMGNKSAHVVCTEDKNGKLVMLPAHQISHWASLVGEIRPAGRNRYSVWTPIWFTDFVNELSGEVKDGRVSIPISKVKRIKQRGGTKASGYKIGSLFYVKADACSEGPDTLGFAFNEVKQLNPTIAVKINFKALKGEEVKPYYFEDK
jgi:hypothetical protein